jgi:hypothetical protein
MAGLALWVKYCLDIRVLDVEVLKNLALFTLGDQTLALDAP